MWAPVPSVNCWIGGSAGVILARRKEKYKNDELSWDWKGNRKRDPWFKRKSNSWGGGVSGRWNSRSWCGAKWSFHRWVWGTWASWWRQVKIPRQGCSESSREYKYYYKWRTYRNGCIWYLSHWCSNDQGWWNKGQVKPWSKCCPCSFNRSSKSSFNLTWHSSL